VDRYGNKAVLQRRSIFLGALSASEAGTPRTTAAVRFADATGKYEAASTPAATALDRAVFSLASGGGLAATYYSGLGHAPAGALRAAVAPSIDWSSRGGAPPHVLSETPPEGFSVRWAGSVRPVKLPPPSY
jgi:hypothetical protein